MEEFRDGKDINRTNYGNTRAKTVATISSIAQNKNHQNRLTEYRNCTLPYEMFFSDVLCRLA